MAVNKVTYGGQTLIDLSTDTVSVATDIVSGKVGHLNTGQAVAGALTFSTIHTGSTTPSSSLGVNGDIYLQTGG